MPDHALPPAELFQHAEFLKRLARGLLRDEHLAEDAVQDAFVAALERPPRAEGALGGWLATVARHFALNRRTSEERRARRERTAARAESVDGDAEVAQRLELQRFVSDLVLHLDEAKRMAIYLRFYEGLEPQAIAARLGVPVKTVKTRLARALAELRERLDARTQGDRGAWVSAFLPLANSSRSALPVATAGIVGGLLMKKTIVAVGLVLAAWLLWRSASNERAETVASAQTESVAAFEPAASAPPPAPPPLASQPAARVAAGGGVATAGNATTLSVQVVAAETGAPLAGIGLALHEPKGAWSTEPGTASSGGLGALRSDTEGRAVFTAPPETELALEVNFLNFAPVDSAHQSIAALAPGEQRALVVRLATAFELVWCGQIVDGTSQTPLAGARVARVLQDPFDEPDTDAAPAQSGADGRVSLAYPSWSQSYARVELDGYATGFVHLDAGHEQPATALPVRLLRAAALEVLVTEPGGAPRAGVEVRASCQSYQRIQGHNSYYRYGPPFAARTDARGRCVFTDLPPELPLDLEVRDGAELLRREERALRLEPGEHRALTWTVGGHCTLAGRTLEADGRPAAGVTVWLLPDDGESLLREYRNGDVTARARSDADGRFTLDVAAGAWLVGPSPTGLSDIAPAAERLVVAPEDTHVEVTLTCWRGLFLRGVVRGPDGAVVPSCAVCAQSEAAFADESVHHGEFSLGPLPQGAYTLSASGYGADGFAPSEPRTVAAGTEGIELVLRRGAELDVTIFDSSGNPASDAMLWILPEPGSEGGLGTSPRDGVAKFTTLPPGTFSVSAATPAGEFALASGVTLTAGNPRELELRLQPAPRLRITLQPPPEGRTNVEVRQDGRPLALVFPDQNPLTALAPGEYELVLQRIGGGRTVELQRQRVTVAADGETSVVFDLAEAR